MSLILDTGPILAFLDRDDDHHAACALLIGEAREELVIPAPVLVEIDYFVRTRLYPEAFTSLIEDVRRGSFRVAELEEEDYSRISEVISKYPQVGFVDAAVLAVVERMGEPKLATLDHRHFRMLRSRHVEALRLLP